MIKGAVEDGEAALLAGFLSLPRSPAACFAKKLTRVEFDN